VSPPVSKSPKCRFTIPHPFNHVISRVGIEVEDSQEVPTVKGKLPGALLDRNFQIVPSTFSETQFPLPELRQFNSVQASGLNSWPEI
jgi:hypothetical protein